MNKPSKIMTAITLQDFQQPLKKKLASTHILTLNSTVSRTSTNIRNSKFDDGIKCIKKFQLLHQHQCLPLLSTYIFTGLVSSHYHLCLPQIWYKPT